MPIRGALSARRESRLGTRACGALLCLCAALAGCARAPAPPPRGLLLITVDTLRADGLGAYGAKGGLTPRLDALARESLVFEAAYAPAPFTFPSIASILSGRYPGALGIRTNLSQLAPDVPTLASALRDHGFRTGAAVSSYVLRGKAGLADDFDVYDDVLTAREANRDSPERIAADTTKAALSVADRLLAPPDAAGARFMLWVHYQDPHGPYTPPEPYAQRARALEPDAGRLPVLSTNHGGPGIPAYQVQGEHREVAWYRAAYRGEIAYTDAEIGRLLDGLGERGLLGDALVVFSADHGEAMGEHDVWFAHGDDLTDELVHVPLLLRAPGLAPGRRSDIVSLVDLYPTLLRRLVGEAQGALPGRDLLAQGAASTDSVPYLDTLAYGPTRRTGLVAEGYKLILSLGDGVWHSRLFRRGQEDVDLAAPAGQVTEHLRERLAQVQQSAEQGVRGERPQQLTPEERARLEALGYAAPEAP